MHKCVDCGFLHLIERKYGQSVVANRSYREEGYPSGYLTEVGCEPYCLHGKDLFSEPLDVNGEKVHFRPFGISGGFETVGGKDFSKEAVLAIINRPRDCKDFTRWRPGFTPKEHSEMLDRDRMLRWQAEREDADRAWRDKQRAEDKRWRLLELIVIGIVSVLVAGGFAVLGAFIERGSIP